MKVTLYMTLTASGQLTRSGEDFDIPPEIFQDVRKHAAEAGNLVIGRRTFEQMSERRAGSPGIELLVMSRSWRQAQGASVVSSPQEALAFLEPKGFRNALLAGGAELYSAFLAENLVTEIFLNIAPLVQGHGLRISFNGVGPSRLRLVGANNLSTQIVQLHYEVIK